MLQIAAHVDVVSRGRAARRVPRDARGDERASTPWAASSRGRSRASRAPSCGPTAAATSRCRRRAATYLDALRDAGVPGPRRRQGRRPLRGRRDRPRATPAPTNAARDRVDDRLLGELDDRPACFTNLIDTDQVYGHRKDVAGFHAALREIDAAVARLARPLRPGDLLVLTADHGVDPGHRHTDHTREHVPLLAVVRRSRRPPPRRAAGGRGRERAALAGRRRRARPAGHFVDV